MPSSACDWSSDVCSSDRSEEHTSELQSRSDLVCRLLLEKKKKRISQRMRHQAHARRFPPGPESLCRRVPDRGGTCSAVYCLLSSTGCESLVRQTVLTYD